MNFIEYAPLALRTVKWLPTADKDLEHAQVGMVTELGELFDAWKKVAVHGKVVDNVNAIEEIGDVFWYVNLLWEVIGEAPEDLQLLWDESIKPETMEIVSTREIDILSDLHIMTSNILSLSLEDTDLIKEELVPYFFAINRLIAATGFEVSDALDKNIRKLAKRYGDKYSDQAALIRDLEVERQTLEA